MPNASSSRKRKSKKEYTEERDISPPPSTSKRPRQSLKENDPAQNINDQSTQDRSDSNPNETNSNSTQKNPHNERQSTPFLNSQWRHGTTEFTEEEEESKEQEEEEEEEEQIDDVLIALLELHDQWNDPRVKTYEDSVEAISDALKLNRALQKEAMGQIAWIKQRILQNEALMRQTRMLSMQESMAQEKKLELHKKFDNKFNFFVDENGETPPIPSSSQSGVSDDVELEKRSWTTSERKRLLSGIHIEAQRVMVFELVAQNNEHKIWDIDKLGNNTLENIEVDKLDWNRISSIHVKTRTPMQCIIQWTTQEHPKINKKPWSKPESQKLMELVEIHGYEGQWEKIAVELNTNRTASQCFSHYQSKHNHINMKRKWTKEDDEALTQAVEMLGERNWQQVAYILGDRTGNQCLQRWTKGICPAIRRQRWVTEEDEALIGAVAAYGVGNWNKVQRHVPGRTDMQCRERYMNVLDPKLNFSKITDEEKTKLIKLVEQHGRRWSHLTQFFPGRTDNHLYRAWMGATKKKDKRKNTQSTTSTPEAIDKSTANEQEEHVASSSHSPSSQ
ncbi:hypothetical protein BDA99DRAFT_501161 [Phascolomyces articulosus]|uniref:Uncharacterized protein n=1 Tax=Phascolomyces articulosus TaxID=60185 RepID=A0AAD5K783_9FUNG|nr:hypothetical protein BDA99DRAFT_501161 [Phascolomyces articulosus]